MPYWMLASALLAQPTPAIDRLEAWLAKSQNQEIPFSIQAQGFQGVRGTMQFGAPGSKALRVRVMNLELAWITTPAGTMEFDSTQKVYELLRGVPTNRPSLDVMPPWAMPPCLERTQVKGMRENKPTQSTADDCTWEFDERGGKSRVRLKVAASGAPILFSREMIDAPESRFAYVFEAPRALSATVTFSLTPPPAFLRKLPSSLSLLPGPTDTLPPEVARAAGLGKDWNEATQGKTTLFWLSQPDCPLTARVLQSKPWQAAATKAGIPWKTVRLTASQFQQLRALGFDFFGTPYGLALSPKGEIMGAYAGFGRQRETAFARLIRDLESGFKSQS